MAFRLFQLLKNGKLPSVQRPTKTVRKPIKLYVFFDVVYLLERSEHTFDERGAKSLVFHLV